MTVLVHFLFRSYCQCVCARARAHVASRDPRGHCWIFLILSLECWIWMLSSALHEFDINFSFYTEQSSLRRGDSNNCRRQSQAGDPCWVNILFNIKGKPRGMSPWATLQQWGKMLTRRGARMRSDVVSVAASSSRSLTWHCQQSSGSRCCSLASTFARISAATPEAAEDLQEAVFVSVRKQIDLWACEAIVSPLGAANGHDK